MPDFNPFQMGFDGEIDGMNFLGLDVEAQ